MGFFDNLSTALGGPDNLLAASNALLQAGAPSRTPVGFGQALGMAGQSVVDAKKKQQQEAMQKMLLDLQLQQHQLAVKRGETEAQQAAAKIAEQARVRDLLANAGKVRPGMGAGLPNGLLPPEMSTGQTFPALQQEGQIDYQDLIRQGAPVEVVKALAESKNFGRSKVARTIDTEGPGGAKTVQSFDEYGAPVGQGVAGYVAPQLVDLGDRKTFAKPAAGQSFGMGQSPESKASNALGWANNALSRQRLALDQGNAVADSGGPSQAAFTKQFGKAAPGYRWKSDGSQEAVPGGPADVKAGAEGEKQRKMAEGAVVQADRVIKKVDEALSKTGRMTAGVGSVLAKIPGTEAKDLETTLETIKANLGFAELQAMRQASPTGGALGAIAVQELTALQSTIASLDQKQSPTQLRQSLGQISKHYKRWKDAVSGAANPQSGGAGGELGGVVDFGSLK